jgi:bacterioferritin-associated ferredoxin
VIACHCHAVSDRTVHAAALAGSSDVADLGRRCGAGTGCGGCHALLADLLDDARRDAGVRNEAAVA